MSILAANIGTAQSATNVSSLTFPHTVSSGTDRLLTVVVAGANTSNNDVSGDYGGTPLVFVDFARTSNSSQKAFMLRLVAPAVGTANVFIDLLTNFGAVSGQAVTWTGVDQTTPMGSTATVQNFGSQNSGTLTGIASNAGDVIFDAIIVATGAGQTLVPDAAQTLLYEEDPTSRAGGSSYKAASAVSSSMSWSWSSIGNWGILGVALKPGASAAPPDIVSITPSSGFTTGGDAVMISGSDFQSGATVTIGGAAATSVVFVSATELTAVTPAGTAGARDVVVTNPDAQADTLTGGFMYSPVNPLALNLYVEMSRIVMTGDNDEAEGMKIERARALNAYVEQTRAANLEIL